MRSPDSDYLHSFQKRVDIKVSKTVRWTAKTHMHNTYWDWRIRNTLDEWSNTVGTIQLCGGVLLQTCDLPELSKGSDLILETILLRYCGVTATPKGKNGKSTERPLIVEKSLLSDHIGLQNPVPYGCTPTPVKRTFDFRRFNLRTNSTRDPVGLIVRQLKWDADWQ